MTDNEKRSHDLAVALCVEFFKVRISEQVAQGKTDVSYDYFHEYMNVYNKSLTAFNEKFPNGK